MIEPTLSRQLFGEWLPDLDPRLVDAATVGGAVFGAISAYNSFRQVDELKSINSKLDTVIDLQLKTLQAIKDLGVQFRIDLEQAFIRDIDFELRGYQQSFDTLISVMKETDSGIEFPTGGPDYGRRLQDLMFTTQDLVNKLSQYGPATYQGLLANVALVEAMFKVAGIDQAYRRKFHLQRLADYERFDGAIRPVRDEADRSIKKLMDTMSYSAPARFQRMENTIWIVYEILGNPRDGFQCRVLRFGDQTWPDAKFVPMPADFPIAPQYAPAMNQYRAGATKVANLDEGVLKLLDQAKIATGKLVKIYE